ncbi:MAG: TIGR01777 family oxidoreductase [Coriobacteriia bacterium]|nr:TIGR01777 family oxidoreductase [Coriobacteriia bacterium]
MYVAIAGGNGFVGRHLTRELVGAGHRVTWLSHRPGRAESLGFAADDVREVVFDYHEPDGAWVEEVASANAVVNLSGYPISSRWNATTVHLIRESRIDTTRALVGAIAGAAKEGTGPQVYVGASGSGYYGDCGDEVLHEDSPPGEDQLAHLAVEWEAEALAACEHDVRVVVMRTGVVMGEEGFLPKILLPMRLFVGGPVGSGRQYFPWVHVADAAGAYAYAIETPGLSGPVNLCSPEQVTMHAFMRALGHVLHRPSWLPVPTFALRIVLGKVAPYMVFSQRLGSAKLSASGYEWRFGSLEQALADAVRHSKRSAREYSLSS